MTVRTALAGAAAGVALMAATPDGRVALANAAELATQEGDRPATTRPVPAGTVAACPVPGARLTSGWGGRWGAFHDGVDLAAPIGTPIRAILAGTVTHSAADDPDGYGSYIEVTSPGGVQVQYGHVSARLVRRGDRVRAGQVIAEVGNEGRSTGPHLHLRIRPNGGHGRGVDPAPWLRARGVRVPCG